MFNINIGPNRDLLRHICFHNLGDLEFDLSRSLKIKCDGAIGLPTYGFLLMVNSNIWPNSAPLRGVRLRNLSDLDFDLFKVTQGQILKCHWTPHI